MKIKFCIFLSISCLAPSALPSCATAHLTHMQPRRRPTKVFPILSLSQHHPRKETRETGSLWRDFPFARIVTGPNFLIGWLAVGKESGNFHLPCATCLPGQKLCMTWKSHYQTYSKYTIFEKKWAHFQSCERSKLMTTLARTTSTASKIRPQKPLWPL